METDLKTLIGIIICVLWVISAVYIAYILNKKPEKKKTSKRSIYFQPPKPYNHFNSTTNTLVIEVKYEYIHKKINR